MKSEKKAYFYVVLTVVLWSSAAAVSKLNLRYLSNLQALFYTSLFASICLFAIVLFQNKLNVIKKYKIKDYWHFAYMGFIGVYLYYICFYASLIYSTAQEAFIVNYTWPIWVIIFAIIILKEKLRFKKILAILLGFIGVYFIMTNGQILTLSFTNLKGHVFALLGAVCYGLFSVIGKKSKYEHFTSMFFYYAFSLIFILATVLYFSHIPVLSLSELIGLFWIGGIASAIGYVTWFRALKYGRTSKMSNFIFLTPFISLVFIYFLVGEEILFSSIIGLVFMVLGIIIQSKK